MDDSSSHFSSQGILLLMISSSPPSPISPTESYSSRIIEWLRQQPLYSQFTTPFIQSQLPGTTQGSISSLLNKLRHRSILEVTQKRNKAFIFKLIQADFQYKARPHRMPGGKSGRHMLRGTQFHPEPFIPKSLSDSFLDLAIQLQFSELHSHQPHQIYSQALSAIEILESFFTSLSSHPSSLRAPPQ